MRWVTVTNLTVACEALLVYRPDCDTGQLCGTWAVTSICRLFDANLLWIQEVMLYLHEISDDAAKRAVQRTRGRNLKSLKKMKKTSGFSNGLQAFSKRSKKTLLSVFNYASMFQEMAPLWSRLTYLWNLLAYWIDWMSVGYRHEWFRGD